MRDDRTNIRLSPRVRIRAKDNASGSRSTISRLTYDGRSGRSGSISFNDTRTVIFSNNVSINMPSTLRSGSAMLIDISSSLHATGTVRKGIADEFQSFGVTQAFSPFNETRSFKFNNQLTDPFHLTGSRIEDVGFGLENPLWSKTRLIIDLGSTESTTLIMSAANTSSLVLGNFPMGYYNFDLRRWERVGRGIALNVDNPLTTGLPPDLNKVTSMFGFSPSFFGTSFLNDTIANPSQSGVPFDGFGFPIHPKFHATSSQQFGMSQLIDRPFIVEKIAYEFEAQFSGTDDFQTDGEVFYNTFFILNQRKPSSSSLGFPDEIFGQGAPFTSSLPSSLIISPNGSPVYVDTSRDIVTWLQVMSHANILNTSSADYVDFVKRELNLVSTSSNSSWAGKYVMSGSAKVPARHSYLSYYIESADQVEVPIAYRFGGRSNTGRPSGRDIGAAMPGNPVTSIILAGTHSVDIIKAETLFSVSPYVLLPGDQLIFGWQAPWPADPVNVVNAFMPSLTLPARPGKLIIYGSQFKAESEFHNPLNQLLTSEAVHEIIQDERDCLDQFDVENIKQFSGSMSAEYVTGSMSVLSSAPSTVAAGEVPGGSQGVGRGVMFSTVGQTKDLIAPGGFQSKIFEKTDVPGFIRMSQTVSENERFFDSLVPSPDTITYLNNSKMYMARYSTTTGGGTSDVAMVVLGSNTGGTNLSSIITDDTWNRAFPFEAKYSSVKRLAFRGLARTTLSSSVLLGSVPKRPGTEFPFTIGQCVELPSGTNDGSKYIALTQLCHAISTGPTPLRYATTHYYGIGDGDSGSVGFKGVSIAAGAGGGLTLGTGSLHRGWKYGLINGFEQKTKAYWCRNHYGYLRDMLEQRLDSKMFDAIGFRSDGVRTGRIGATSSPVKIKFVEPRTSFITSPTKTFSSNLSNEATSSVPYFDGQVRNREEPLDLTNINSTTTAV